MPDKKVAIVQSNYIPWKGYIDMMAYVDEFVLFDDAQYTRRDWRNRNQIKTAQGLQWLTVPVLVKGNFAQAIRDTRIDGTAWMKKHWKSLTLNYRKAPYFEDVSTWLAPLYEQPQAFLTDLNQAFLQAICDYLHIKTCITRSSEYTLPEGKTERVAAISEQAGASEYLTGPAAKSYMDESVFQNLGIDVRWMEYEGYPEYQQLWGEFKHNVTVLDLLFNCGTGAAEYMKFVQNK